MTQVKPTDTLEAAAREALAAFGMPDAEPEPTRQSGVFRLEGGPGERLKLRLHGPAPSGDDEDWHAPAVVRSELAWREALARDTGMPLLLPVPGPGGDPLTPVRIDGQDACATLLRGPAGEWRRIQSREEFLGRLAECARQTARIHEHAQTWAPPAGFERPALDRHAWDQPLALLRDLARDDLFCPSDQQLVEAATVSALELFDRVCQRPGAWGLIHGSLSWRRWLHTDDGLQPTGFESCAFGPYLYDLAVALGGTHPSARRHFLDAYEEVRPLPDGVADGLTPLLFLHRVRNQGGRARDPGSWFQVSRAMYWLANADARDVIAGRSGVHTSR
jgi:Ser/Thr protein kinase RdoA (MazF antagonist)